MSVVIAYISDFISIIATDTRVSYGYDLNNLEFTDDNQKLYNLNNLGWAAGTGAHRVIDEVKKELSLNTIRSVGDIKNIYGKVLTMNFSEYQKDILDSTSILISWFGLREDGVTEMCRIGVLDTQKLKDEGINVISKDKFCILYPIDYENNKPLKNNLINQFDLNYEFEGGLGDVLKKIIDIFEVISDNSNGVSSICDIGLSYLDYSGRNKIEIKGEIKTLKKSLIEGTIENYIKKVD